MDNSLFKNHYLLREFYLNYILASSRKSDFDHCVIRLILSSLATPEEIINLTKKDLKEFRGFQTVRLYSRGKYRISPIDRKTFELILRLGENRSSGEPIFNLSKKEIDDIVLRYSPPFRKLSAMKLRDEVISIIQDGLFFEEYNEIMKKASKDPKRIFAAFEDSNPIYSGVWDFEDDEYLREFIEYYMAIIGEEDIQQIADRIHEPIERLKRIMIDQY
jgi:hypothetical protein